MQWINIRNAVVGGERRALGRVSLLSGLEDELTQWAQRDARNGSVGKGVLVDAPAFWVGFDFGGGDRRIVAEAFAKTRCAKQSSHN